MKEVYVEDDEQVVSIIENRNDSYSWRISYCEDDILFSMATLNDYKTIPSCKTAFQKKMGSKFKKISWKITLRKPIGQIRRGRNFTEITNGP